MPTQQFELYAAERAVDPGARFESLAAVQEWVNHLRDQWWWEKWLPSVLAVEVGPARRGANMSVGWFEPKDNAGRMEFNTPTPSRQLVIHELSHVLASARHNSQSHDPWFARVYYELTYLIRGPKHAKALADSFTAAGIDYDAAGLA